MDDQSVALVRPANTLSAMNDGGGFTYTFVAPARAAKGQATVTAVPYNIDWCDDTGRNNPLEGAIVVDDVDDEVAVLRPRHQDRLPPQ
ncbi:hypothetical protein [Arthrobacter globiformis]|uniref:hypothetical protein n=1 Tax=Arthrobacter globiformis TaxID=1665 RepID=UPI001112B47C|nr:hypothetical protein [Arthrobacter globiformis]